MNANMTTPRRAILVAWLCAGLLALGLLCGSAALAASPEVDLQGPQLDTNVGGHITSDTTWALAGSPYILTSDVIVDAGVTLTIEQGVMVKGGGGIELEVLGHLDAQGTPSQPITFTSVADTGPNQWSGLVFDGGTGILKHAIVRYGGHSNSLGPFSNIAVRNVLSSEVRIEDSRVMTITSGNVWGQGVDYGLYIENSHVTVSNTLFTGNGDQSQDYTVYIKGASSIVTLTNNSLIGNANDRVYLANNAMTAADITLTRQTALQAYQIEGLFIIPADRRLTVEPDVTVMGNQDAELKVLGHLDAQGTSTQPITLTSVTNTGPNQWKGLSFDGGTGYLKHATVRYGGNGNSILNSGATGCNLAVRNVLSSEVRIEDSQVMAVMSGNVWGRAVDYGLYIENSHVTVANTLFSHNGDPASPVDYALYATGANTVLSVTGSTFENNYGWPIRVAPDMAYHLANNSFAGNANNRVLVAGGTLMVGRRMAYQVGLDGYELASGVVVPGGITLTIEAGAAVMGRGGVELQVQGHLEAQGTPGQPITFTSVTNTGPNQWSGLVFDGGMGILKHAIVRYGGNRNSLGFGGTSGSNIAVRNVLTGEVRIEDSRVMTVTSGDVWGQAVDYGLYIENSHVTVSNTFFTGSGDQSQDHTVYIKGASSVVTLTNNSLIGNANDRVYLANGAMTAQSFALAPQAALQAYQLEGLFTIPQRVTLTIESGVTVMGNWDAELRVLGHLDAQGASTQPITFTSLTNTGPNQWNGLSFDGGTGYLKHATVRYGGHGNSVLDGVAGCNIVVRNVLTGEVRIEDSQVVTVTSGNVWGQPRSYGLYIDSGYVVVSNTLVTGNTSRNDNAAIAVQGDSIVQVLGSAIQGNSGHGVRIDGNTAVFTMTNSTVMLNGADGVRNNGTAVVTLGDAPGLGNSILGNQGFGARQVASGGFILATCNWWGDPTGPYHPTANPGGKGSQVSDNVLFIPWAQDSIGTVAEPGVALQVFGPQRVSPGGTVDYAIGYANVTTGTVENAVVVMVLPLSAEYMFSTMEGIFWPEQHQVFWKLGNLAAGAGGSATIRVRYRWGLPTGSNQTVTSLIGGTNVALGLSVTPYLAYIPQEIVGLTPLTDAQLQAERASYPTLEQFYTQALTGGYLAGGAVRYDLRNGAPITQVVLLEPRRGATLYLRRQGDSVLVAEFGRDSYTVRTTTGGIATNLQTEISTYWGSWGSGETPTTEGECFAGCGELPIWLVRNKAQIIEGLLRSFQCQLCAASQDPATCAPCFAALQQASFLPEAPNSLACASDCGISLAYMEREGIRTLSATVNPSAPHPPKKITGTTGDQYITCRHKFLGLGQEVEYTWFWNEGFNGWDYQSGMTRECPSGTKCVAGLRRTGNEGVGCVPCNKPKPCPTPRQSPQGTAESCGCGSSSAAEASPLESTQPMRAQTVGSPPFPGISDCSILCIVPPRDPNAKYGWQGDVLPGQLLTYTITYENEGAGRAYGVYITDRLSEHLDTSTLTLYGPASYVATNRTIYWFIGELGPKGELDSKGEVSFTARLKNNLPGGTTIINQATVYFPSVPEETPTNPVVNVVQPVAALPQSVETTYMQPVTITLQGLDPGGAPLTYTLVTEPWHGVLSGVTSTLVYTPMANFTGQDLFSFKVRNAVTESRPAEVTILVLPSAADTTPPQVLWTVPVSGATGVAASAQAIFTDDVGPLYGPLPLIQFSEAISAATVTTATARLVDGNGQALAIGVTYDGTTDQAMILPRQALQGGTRYTVTLTSGVQDLMGNALAGDYAFSFSTEPRNAVLSLQSGWNLVSLPLAPENTAITRALESIAGHYDLAYAYTAQDVGDPWKKYNVAAPAFLNDLRVITESMGLWIRANEAVSLTVTGTVGTRRAVSLRAGWNLVGYPSLTTRPVTEALASIDGEYDLIYAYKAVDVGDPWKKYNVAAPSFLNDLKEMEPGWGYWIRVKEDCVWQLP